MPEEGWDSSGLPAGVDANGLFDGRYALGTALKRGNGVVTYLAEDVRTGAHVVLKSIDARGVHGATRLRFEHETRVLRTLTGTGLTGLYDSGEVADQLYLVQPHIPGVTLEGLLRSGPLPVPVVLRLGIAIAAALDTAHEAGIVHRDVKPANVIIEGSAAETVTLIDFGFARSPHLDESVRDNLVGTVRYLAPEAAGLLAAPADERSDLYAVGVLLFECLVGAPPFPGPGVADLLRQHLTMPVPDVCDLRPGVPRVLDAILQRMLRKDPVDRYQSASALAYDLASLSVALASGDTDPRMTIGLADRRHSLTDPAFVGRDAELAALESLVTETLDGGGGLVLLEAESGGGKSRLLAEVSAKAGGSGVTVLRGQGVKDAAQQPLTLLQGIVRDLVTRDDTAPLRESLVERLGDSGPTIARVLPALQPLVAVAEDTGPEAFGEQRTLAALRDLIESIATPTNPILLVLDDCQWADQLTVRLLAETFATQQPPAHLGIIAAFRSEEVSSTHRLRAIDAAKSLHLGRLSDAAMSQLAESMAGPLPEPAVATVVRLSDGSPFMGAAVMRGLVECGALTASDDGWAVDDAALAEVQTERRSAAILVRRLDLLTAGALRVLSTGAVLGKEFDIAQAVELAGESETAAVILEQVLRRRLLWVDDRSGRCVFFHDRIREALLARLDDDTRRGLHSRVADSILSQPIDDSTVFDVAYHLDAAGRGSDGLLHALRAAEIARARYGLDSAVAHFRMAQRAVADTDLQTCALIATGLGDVLTLQGAYAHAQQELELAKSLTEEPLGQAALDGKLGNLAFKQGDLATARRHLEGAMARLGRRVPTRTPLLLVLLVWEVLVQVAHSVLPKLTNGRRSPEDGAEDFLMMHLHSRLAYVYWFSSGKVSCAWSHLRGLNLAERYPPGAELGQAYSEHAPVMTMLPWFGRSLRYASRSLAIRRDNGDVWGQGQSQSFAGVTLYAASRFDEGAEACREASRLLQSTGDQWEVNTAHWNLALCHYRKGELKDAVHAAIEVYQAAMAIGDETSAGVALSVWTRASGGRVDPALIHAELSRGSEDASTTAELHLAAGLCALHRGDFANAADQLGQAAAVIRAAGLRQEYAAPVASWNATVSRLLAENVSAYDPAERRRALRHAAKHVRRARVWALSYKNNAPHALREAGLVAALRGRPRRAVRRFERSMRISEQQGARYETALTQRALVRSMPAGEGAADLLEVADNAVLEFERPLDATVGDDSSMPTVSIFDRFNTLLSVGRTIAAAPTAAALDDAIRQAALALLHGERCHVVNMVDLPDEDSVTESGEWIDGVSRTLLNRAAEERVPVVTEDPTVDGSESLILSGIRSVLAAPIVVDDEVSHCFYITHRQIGHLFGEDEIQLASFIATLAGAASEHLAGTEARFRSIGQNSSDVLTLVDNTGSVVYQSSAVARLFEMPAPGLTGHPVLEWVHPEDRELFQAALDRATREAQARVECRLRHADGTYLYAETAVTNLLNDPAVGSFVLNTHDVTERRRLEDELRVLALSDQLTGLPNRMHFLERTRRALAEDAGQPLVMCFVDLDDFKAVNDAHGHGAGDLLLKCIATRLTEGLRPEDTVARFGGDEFALLIENTDLPGAVRVVERLLESVSAPVDIGDIEVVTHISIGLATSDGRQCEPGELLAEADAAMYAAKARGANRYKVFHPDMRVAAETRSRVRADLDHALLHHEFRLHYQPIIDLRSGERLGIEALIRWQHPEQGLLNPTHFIGQAEASGQIGAIGEWVLSAACHATAAMSPETYTSINLSARQLRLPLLVQRVQEALDSSGLPASRLVLELTETTTVADLPGAIDRLHELKALGLHIALDDFGTGYSPLSHLRRFPVDILKIDRSFVRNIAHSREDRAIVRGVIDMAHRLGLRTIAEGIEKPEQLRIMTELGCDSGQGYLWTRPVPLESLAAG